MPFDVKRLSDCPEQLKTVGSWIYREWWKATYSTPEPLLSRLAGHLQDNGIPLTLVAFEEDGDPVGSCCLIESDCELRPQYSPWVAAVYVRPEYRRRGAASALLQEAAAVAGRLGIGGLYIDCWAATAPLYRQNGWRVLERDVGQRDSLVMYREIPPTQV